MLKQRMAAMAAPRSDGRETRLLARAGGEGKTRAVTSTQQHEPRCSGWRRRDAARTTPPARMLEMRAAFDASGEAPGIESAAQSAAAKRRARRGRRGDHVGTRRRAIGVVADQFGALRTREPTPNDFVAKRPCSISRNAGAGHGESHARGGRSARAGRWRRASPPRSRSTRADSAFEEEPEELRGARAVAREAVARETVAREAASPARSRRRNSRPRALGGRGARRSPRAPRARRPRARPPRLWLLTRDAGTPTARRSTPRRARDEYRGDRTRQRNQPREPVYSPRVAHQRKGDSPATRRGDGGGAIDGQGVRDDARRLADAVARARASVGGGAAAQARSYSSKKSRTDDAPPSPSRHGDAAAYAPLPSAPPPSATDARRRVDMSLSDPVAPFFEEAAATTTTEDAGDDARSGGRARASERRRPPRPPRMAVSSTAGSAVAPRRPVAAERARREPRVRGEVSDSDDGDDGDDGAARRRRRRGMTRAEDVCLEFDFGVVAEHEAAMARLLGPSRGGGPIADYGATRRVPPRRRAERLSVHAYGEDDEDGAREETKSAYGGGVSFSNALPKVR